MGANPSKVAFLFFLPKLLQYTVLTKKGSRTASGLWSRGLLNDQGTIKKVNQTETQFGIIQNC